MHCWNPLACYCLMAIDNCFFFLFVWFIYFFFFKMLNSHTSGIGHWQNQKLLASERHQPFLPPEARSVWPDVGWMCPLTFRERGFTAGISAQSLTREARCYSGRVERGQSTQGCGEVAAGVIWARESSVQGGEPLLPERLGYGSVVAAGREWLVSARGGKWL